MTLLPLLWLAPEAAADACGVVKAQVGSFPSVRRSLEVNLDKEGRNRLAVEERPWLDPEAVDPEVLPDAAGDVPLPPRAVLTPEAAAMLQVVPAPAPPLGQERTIVLRVTLARDGILRDPIPAGTPIDLELATGPVTLTTLADAEAQLDNTINYMFTRWALEADLPLELARRLGKEPIVGVQAILLGEGLGVEVPPGRGNRISRALRCFSWS